MLKRKRPRPPLNRLDRFFWTALRCIWPRWWDLLVIVKPETVVGWHRVGFRLYWRWRSRSRGGRPRVSEEVRTLIRLWVSETPNWPTRTLPTAEGTAQQLRNAFPWDTAPSYLLRDRDAIFGDDFDRARHRLDTPRVPGSYDRPQIGFAIPACKGVCLVLSPRQDTSLDGERHAGNARLRSRRSLAVVAIAEVGGLHRRYERRAAFVGSHPRSNVPVTGR